MTKKTRRPGELEPPGLLVLPEQLRRLMHQDKKKGEPASNEH
ncbi:hypothetical protein WOC76_17625 [Methylocystis sp. IM3]